MKKSIIIFILFLLNIPIFAQAPQSFNYQGLARDNSGIALISQNISIKASILDGSPVGTLVYGETFSALTNQFGLFTLGIGTGSVINGLFANINWSTGNKYLKIEMDPAGGSNYSLSGTTQLLSVPYAMYAANSGSAGPWQNNINGINYTPGNVGIGTSSPNHVLEIVADKTKEDAGFADTRNLLHIQNVNSSSLSYAGVILSAGPTGSVSGLALSHYSPTYYNEPNTSSLFNIEGAGLNLGTWGATPAPINFAIGNPSNYVMTIASNGSVGIGTTNPSSVLHTIGTVRFQGLTNNNLLTTALVTDLNGNVYTKDISSIGNSVWQTNLVGINYNGGKVGIGTSTPSTPLSIEYSGTGATVNRMAVSIVNTSNEIDHLSNISLAAGTNSTSGLALTHSGDNYAYNNNAGVSIVANVGKGLNLQSGNTANSKLMFSTGISPVERMRIDNLGNIGIGTTTPKSLLHVASGDIYIDDATKGIIMKNSGGQCYRITLNASGALTSTSITCP